MFYPRKHCQEQQHQVLGAGIECHNPEEKGARINLLANNYNKLLFDIQVPQDGHLVWKIPYAKNWKIFIDGREKAKEEINWAYLSLARPVFNFHFESGTVATMVSPH
ncbi:MAG: hypothetical protein WCG27_11485 [Pseudomonadota bacterium]